MIIDGFEWIQLMKYDENVITFIRKTDKPEETLLAVCNFAGIPYKDYQTGVPFAGNIKRSLTAMTRSTVERAKQILG